MKFFKIQKIGKLFTDLKFALAILFFIAIASSLGSFIEQDEGTLFYQENYPLSKPVYGFIDWNFILRLGLDHIYRTWWFLLLLLILGICLISCTATRQFPLLINSKDFIFKREKKSFLNLPFFVEIKKNSYLKENILLKIQEFHFYIYQNQNYIYGYKGLIGRIGPILVHLSLIIILIGSSIGAFKNFKAQEILPKGESFHIQNPIQVGWLTSLPNINTRVNDFWVEYEKKKIHQFYSNLSILDNYGKEIKEQTISVNNPLRYKNIDFYQSDWNLLGIRVGKSSILKNEKEKKIYEFPLFNLSLTKNSAGKTWLTWLKDPNNLNKNYTLIFDQLENTFSIYDENGTFLKLSNLGDILFQDSPDKSSILKNTSSYSILEILPSTGLLIKYDPSIGIIYFGFGLLMITTSLSFLPYTQIWVFHQAKNSWMGGITNRGKIQLEIEFENLIRKIENINVK